MADPYIDGEFEEPAAFVAGTRTLPVRAYFGDNEQLRDDLKEASLHSAGVLGRWDLGGWTSQDETYSKLALDIHYEIELSHSVHFVLRLEVERGATDPRHLELLRDADRLLLMIIYNETMDDRDEFTLTLPLPPDPEERVLQALLWLRGSP